jgi:hypothetical protein
MRFRADEFEVSNGVGSFYATLAEVPESATAVMGFTALLTDCFAPRSAIQAGEIRRGVNAANLEAVASTSLNRSVKCQVDRTNVDSSCYNVHAVQYLSLVERQLSQF